MKKLRMAIDLAMTIVLVGLMAYSLIGTLTHEILGMAMVILFTVHHIMNRRWFGALPKGRYNSFRVFQTVLVFLMIGSVLASAVSGIMLSEHLYTFLPVSKGTSIARSVHMVCAYLNYILMSLHLGQHWKMMISAMRKNNDQKSIAGRWACGWLQLSLRRMVHMHSSSGRSQSTSFCGRIFCSLIHRNRSSFSSWIIWQS